MVREAESDVPSSCHPLSIVTGIRSKCFYIVRSDSARGEIRYPLILVTSMVLLPSQLLEAFLFSKSLLSTYRMRDIESAHATQLPTCAVDPVLSSASAAAGGDLFSQPLEQPYESCEFTPIFNHHTTFRPTHRGYLYESHTTTRDYPRDPL